MRVIQLSGLLLSLALLAGAPCALAQSADEAAVTQNVAAFTKAMLGKDKATLEKLCAEQMSYGHSSNRMETKQQFIDDATGPRSVWKFIDISGQSVQVAGNNAIVRHVLTGETDVSGKVSPVKIGVLMVWTKADGSWKLLARQAFRI
jgi:ketosteroid isomerase-like protein